MAVIIGTSTLAEPPAIPETRAKAQKLMLDGNFKDALTLFRELLLRPDTDPKLVGKDLTDAVQCLNQLGIVDEFDELLEGCVAVHAKNWRLLQTAAESYRSAEHYGFIVAGEFQRGGRRGGGQHASSVERDRTQGLKLLAQALPMVTQDDDKAAAASFFLSLAEQLQFNRSSNVAWRLQSLTDLNTLPDYDEVNFYGLRGMQESSGAPVDVDGNPVFHKVSRSWEAAESDGQRWRWALEQAAEYDRSRRDEVQYSFGQFLQSQFDVTTIQEIHGWRPFSDGPEGNDGTAVRNGIIELHTLTDDETIARLANGIRRFKLPDEFNFLKIFQQLAQKPGAYQQHALMALGDAFENRRQYPRAAEYWKELVKVNGRLEELAKSQERRLLASDPHEIQRFRQIVDNWGRFEPTMTQPAGSGAQLDLRFRNAKSVKFSARPIKVDKLLTDLKTYLKSNPRDLDWSQIQLENIGWRLINEQKSQYLSDPIANWDMQLEPRPNHFDRRVTVATPLQKAGAYFVTATMPSGNESSIVVWIADTAIVSKRLSDRNLYYVADAASGVPVDKANLEFFGFQWENFGQNQHRIVTHSFAEKTNSDGIALPEQRDLKQQYQWLVIARGPGGRMAFQGFQNVWYQRFEDQAYNAIKVFTITDRPVYRPKQTTHFKFWVRQAQYDADDKPQFQKVNVPIEIHNPQGEKIFEQTLLTDEYGGVEGSWEIPADAKLGTYQLVANPTRSNQILASGGGTFRVEEYKKPEFEVTVSPPTEPVQLGEKITARIDAKYLFGSPVTQGTVKYKITRSTHHDTWYPIAPWDWCYGPGYWWFAYDCPWYPGWRNWAGCIRPVMSWWPGRFGNQPPELVAEQELPLTADGGLDVQIDTAIAKELHGDNDHEYTITAEVRDESRRTIVGTGRVLVARKPFKVYGWLTRGFYRVGDAIESEFMAQTIDNKPVVGTGELTLYKVTYDEKRQPKELPVQTWKLDTNEEGRLTHQFQASSKGQFRLAYRLTDSQEHTVEGGYLFTIIGDGFDGREYRFSQLELIPDRRDYAPGQKVKLQLNSDRPDATILLFVRPSNGLYQAPKIVRMKGKSTVVDLDVTKKDMPNFFVEAVTVFDARAHMEAKELVVPPEKRVLNVDVLPSQKEYKPGEDAKIKVRLTDFQGENFSGTTVIAIYDKAVEYISGGSNVPDIREFYWKWRRQHQPNQVSNLQYGSQNLTTPNDSPMNDLGAFGASDADGGELELARSSGENDLGMRSLSGGMRQFGGGGGLGGAPLAGPGGRAAPAMMADGLAMSKMNAAAGPGATEVPAGSIPVRSNFADTALWVGAINTDKTGVAEVPLKMPENLTGWKVKVWALGHGTRVGSGEAEVVTRKNLIVRLQSPRFLVEKDEVILSGNVHNYLSGEKSVQVRLDIDIQPGERLLEPLDELIRTVIIPAGGERRVDWRVKVAREGSAVVRMSAVSDEESDAMEVKVPVYVHGMLKQEAWAGTIRPDQPNGSIKIRVPEERRPEQTVLEIRYSPSLAMAMVDALPYLAEYPYGCTEQTLNRFLPSVITQKLLQQLNIDLSAIETKRSNLNAQELGDDRERSKQWKRFDRNPVFEKAELDRMVKDGATALFNMQNADGGWGWFSGRGEHSGAHTTAVVVHGLQIAQQNDVAILPDVLERGLKWLEKYQQEEVLRIQNAKTKKVPAKEHADDLDAFVYMVLVDGQRDNKEMRELLYRDRNHLAVYGKALLGMGLHRIKDAEKLAMIMQNMEQFLVQDAENETAYLRLPENTFWWYWYGSDVEANAYYLKLLARTDPKGTTAPRLVKYLLNQRKHASYWSSTRDTGLCVEALGDFIRASGEQKPDMKLEIWVDGKRLAETEIRADNLFTYTNKLVLRGDELTSGEHQIELRRQGTGPVYFNAYLQNFTLEDPITKTGLEVKVDRKIYKLVPVQKTRDAEGSRGQVLQQRVEKYERQLVGAEGLLKSGDLLEVELELESKNDYEYLLFEDLKAAGCESVEVRSGYGGNGLGAYVEYRDERVSFFLRVLPRGKHSVSYRLRAEVPGKFSALPARAFAMYAPELKANSNEQKIRIED